MHASNYLDLRLTEIGSDVGVSQGRAQADGMARGGQVTTGLHTQAFFFNATANALQFNLIHALGPSTLLRGEKVPQERFPSRQ